MNLIVCTPGIQFSHNFLRSFLTFQNYCFRKGINVQFSINYSPNLYIARNAVVGGNSKGGENQKPWNGKVNYDYILWVDSDIVFSPENFEKLLSANKQIISGLYFLHDERRLNFAAIKNWDEDYFNKHGRFEWLSKKDVDNCREPFKVDHIGMGFMLMKAGILENLPYPWFRPKIANFLSVIEICTEDISFCHLIKEKGFNVWVHPEVIVKHEKSILL